MKIIQVDRSPDSNQRWRVITSAQSRSRFDCKIWIFPQIISIVQAFHTSSMIHMFTDLFFTKIIIEWYDRYQSTDLFFFFISNFYLASDDLNDSQVAMKCLVKKKISQINPIWNKLSSFNERIMAIYLLHAYSKRYKNEKNQHKLTCELCTHHWYDCKCFFIDSDEAQS